MGHPDPSPIRAIRTTRQLPPILVPSVRARGSRSWHHVTSSQGERRTIRDSSNAEPSWPLLESVLLSFCPREPLKRISNSAIRGQDLTSKAQGVINILQFQSHLENYPFGHCWLSQPIWFILYFNTSFFGGLSNALPQSHHTQQNTKPQANSHSRKWFQLPIFRNGSLNPLLLPSFGNVFFHFLPDFHFFPFTVGVQKKKIEDYETY